MKKYYYEIETLDPVIYEIKCYVLWYAIHF